MTNSASWSSRLKAGGIHLGLSVGVSALAAGLVFGLWYPYPYRDISGGRELFSLVVSVDVVIGPLITLVVYDARKSWVVMRRDLLVVALVQTAALAYGLWTVFIARPVHLVFEYNRFSVVHAVEVPMETLSKAPPALQSLPLWGTTILSLRPFKDSSERMDATMAALGGVPLAARPDLWQPYAAAKAEVLSSAKPVTVLRERFPAQRAAIDSVVAQTGRAPDSLSYVPMTGRKSFWTVLLDSSTADVLGFLPLDSF